jgi:anti-anti-sigma regulatory factor
MEIIVSEEEARVPVTVFQIKGELAADTESQLVQQAQEAYAAGTRNLLLDLSKVTFLSSGGLRGVHQIFVLLRGDSPEQSDDAMRAGIKAGTYHSSHLKLLKPNSEVSKVLRATGFDMFLEIYSSRSKALASF